MADGKILQRYQPYSPLVPANYPGVAPTINADALDSVAAMANYKNAKQVYVDVTNGSDVTGTGAQLRPYQSIEAAFAAIALLPADNYVLMLAPGAYGTGPVVWPVVAGTNISVFGSGDAAIVQPITYTAIGGVIEENVIFQNVGISDITIDLSAAAAKVSQLFFSNCSVNLNRVDSLPAGPQVVRIADCFIGTLSTNATVIVVNGQWIGGPANNIGATGNLLVQGGLAAAMTYNIAAGGQMLIEGSIASFSTFNVNGTLTLLGTVPPGATIGGAGMLITDASSLAFGTTVTVASTVLADNAENVGFSPAVPASWPVGTDQVKEALDYLVTTGSGDMKRNAFVFQPGGAAGGNTYTTWADVMAAITANAGPKTIYFDDSFVSPAVIPAGAYALEEVSFDNARRGQSCAVQVAAGVTWTGLVAINNVEIEFLNTAVVESIGQRAMFFEGTTITANGTAPIWDTPLGSQFQCFKGTFLNGTPASPIVDVPAGQTFILVLGQNSSTNTVDCISGTGTSTLLVFKDASGVFSTQAAFAGTQSQTLVDNAQNVAYSPSVSGNWPAPAPTQVASALDTTAAQVSQVNPKQVWVDIVKGSDVTGTGSQLRPFASLPAALAYIALQGAGSYMIEMGPGLYTGAPIAWPDGSGGESVGLNGPADTCTIGHAISVTAAAVANYSFVCSGVGFSTPIVFDLALAAAAQVRFSNCGLAIQRIDSNPAVVLAIINCGISSIDVTGSNNNVEGCFLFGTTTVQAASSLRVIGSQIVFGVVNAIGTLDIITSFSSIPLAGAGTVRYDATSKKLTADAGGSVTAATQVMLDDAQDVGYTPATPADWSTVPDDVKEALDTLAADARETKVEFRTLSAPEAAAEQLTLANTPAVAGETVVIALGVGQFYADDYSVAGNILSWSGVGQMGDTIVPAAGDKFVIIYDI